MMSSDDPWSGATDVSMDAWARPYRVDALAASVLSIESAGEDGTFGDENDIEHQLNVTPIRRAKALDRLETINQAITQYNGAHLPDEPLPLGYDALVTKLVTSGFLPSTSSFLVDGWGDPFVPSPEGKSPVVAVTSSHLESSSGASDGASTGSTGGGEDKKDKKKGEKSGSAGKKETGKKETGKKDKGGKKDK
jgi:hypothetical protein